MAPHGTPALLKLRATWPWWAGGLLAAIFTYDPNPGVGNVYRIYREAAQNWLQGAPLYVPGNGFQYLPSSVLVWIPTLVLPVGLGGVAWKALNWGLFAAGLQTLLKSESRGLSWSAPLLAAGAALTAGRHGQATLAMAGLVLLGLSQAQSGKAWSSAILLALAVVIKPLALVWIGLICMRDHRLGLRALFLAVLLSMWTVTGGRFDYAWGQWQSLLPAMARVHGDALFDPKLYGFHTLLAAIKDPLSESALSQTRAAAALAFAAFAALRLRHSHRPFCLYLLGATYVLLFSSRTENNTYGLLAPVFAICWLRSKEAPAAPSRTLCLLLWVAFSSTRSLAGLHPSLSPGVLRPLITLALAALYIWQRQAIHPSSAGQSPRPAKAGPLPTPTD